MFWTSGASSRRRGHTAPRQAAPPVPKGLRDARGAGGASKRQGYADPVRANSRFAYKKLVSYLDLYGLYDFYHYFVLYQLYMLFCIYLSFFMIEIIILINLISLVRCCITKAPRRWCYHLVIIHSLRGWVYARTMFS
jgi:hypothetical protein